MTTGKKAAGKQSNPQDLHPAEAAPSGLDEANTTRAKDSGILPGTPPVINSEALLVGRSEIQIRHRGEIYRLTLTRTGKLILHK